MIGSLPQTGGIDTAGNADGDRTRDDDIAPSPRPHVAGLDGLRGVAILMVLAVHCSQTVAGLASPVRDLAFYGVRGVQLFFIVSGFTLALNYAGRPFRPLAFAARRFFRIAPMFYGGVILYLVLATTTSATLSTRGADAADVAATVLFVHGWVPDAINRVVPGGWSIAAEAMFYLCFPLLLPLLSRPWAMTGVLGASYGAAVGIHVLLRLLIPGSGGNEIGHYFWALHFPAFAGGCWLATLMMGGRDTRSRRFAGVLLALSVIGMIVDSQLRGKSNLLVAITLLILFTWAAMAARPRVLESRMLVLIGQISFSLYIVHFAVIAAIHPLVSMVEPLVGSNLAFALVFASVLAIAGTIAWQCYLRVELPMMRIGRHFGRKPAP